MALADDTRLKQIFVNILSNAVDFTKVGGKVTLRASCREDSGYLFQVVDTGAGIAPANISITLVFVPCDSIPNTVVTAARSEP